MLASPPCPPAPLTASPDQSSDHVHHHNPLLPLLMTSFCPISISSKSTSVPAFRSHVRDPISPVPRKSRSRHYGDNPAPPLQPWAGHALLAHPLERFGHECRAGARVGCAAPEAGGCWWMGGKDLRKVEQLETEANLLRTCAGVSKPCHHRSCSWTWWHCSSQIKQLEDFFSFPFLMWAKQHSFTPPYSPCFSWKWLNWLSWQY